LKEGKGGNRAHGEDEIAERWKLLVELVNPLLENADLLSVKFRAS
jgi:hypothetical protein